MENSADRFLHVFFEVVHDNVRSDLWSVERNSDASFPSGSHVQLQLLNHPLDVEGLPHS